MQLQQQLATPRIFHTQMPSMYTHHDNRKNMRPATVTKTSLSFVFLSLSLSLSSSLALHVFSHSLSLSFSLCLSFSPDFGQTLSLSRACN